MNSLKFQSVFDIIGPVMIAHPVVTLQVLFELVKLFLLSLERNQKKLSSNYLIPSPKPIVVMEQI